MIAINKVSKSYGFKQVLFDIDLLFEKGKVYGIVGENGAGKTTLFNCISGLESHDGSIDSEWIPLKDHLGLLQTIPYYFSKITGREYIQLLCNARKVIIKDIDARNIFDLPLDQYASTYSTGMKKKLALNAILLQQNDVYILDEPFNGVDIQSNMIIVSIIEKLKSLGKLVLISSHIFSTLQDTCDELFLLREGRIVKRVMPESFTSLENDMKKITVGDKVDKLHLE